MHVCMYRYVWFNDQNELISAHTYIHTYMHTYIHTYITNQLAHRQQTNTVLFELSLPLSYGNLFFPDFLLNI